MIYRRFIILILFSATVQIAFCAEFGEYQYSKYVAIQDAIKNRQAMAQRIQSRYNTNPTRNIQFPNSSNPYPNIQRTQTRQLNAYQRYSPNYYQSL